MCVFCLVYVSVCFEIYVTECMLVVWCVCFFCKLIVVLSVSVFFSFSLTSICTNKKKTMQSILPNREKKESSTADRAPKGRGRVIVEKFNEKIVVRARPTKLKSNWVK